MLRAVLDANVYVGAYVRPEGPPGRTVERFLRDSAFESVLSAEIADEVLRALAYPKVRGAARTSVDPALWFEDLAFLSEIVSGDVSIGPLSSDPDDDKYIAAALEGRADFVVSGDPDLLEIAAFDRVRIVSPRAFLDMLEGSG